MTAATRATRPQESAAELAVIGAGPAGMAAAASAAEHGASVLVIDAGEQPGGQFWRHRPEDTHADDGALHHNWAAYLRLRARFDAQLAAGRIRYLPGRHVWMAQREAEGFRLRTTASVRAGSGRPGAPAPAEAAGSHRAAALVLCAGGYDRQLPVPGWDLPGVMAAGGIQAFIKNNGSLPGERFVVAGTGPFLLPVAANITQAGGRVAAVCESAPLTGWLPHALTAAQLPEKAIEGAHYVGAFLRHRIPYRIRTRVIEVLGEDRVRAVRTARVTPAGAVVPGSERLIDGVDAVGFGWGFTPQLELAVALGAETRLDDDGSLIGVVDEQLRSSVPGVFLAGEVTGVGGAGLAILEGEIAGRVAAGGGAPAPAQLRKARRYRGFARAMHLAHPVPAGWAEALAPDTLVCRCEEVRAGEISGARRELHASDARSQKSMTRAGMGWCQGRVCGFAVSCLSAPDGRASLDSLRQVAKRPVGLPLPLAELLDLDEPAT